MWPRAHSRLIELIARRFRGLADPTRIKLLDQLRRSEASVQELTETTGSTQQNVSKHFGVLLHAGIVERRKAGDYTSYGSQTPPRLSERSAR